MSICVVTGPAARTAALSVRDKISPRRLDVSELQKILMEQGAILYEDQFVCSF